MYKYRKNRLSQRPLSSQEGSDLRYKTTQKAREWADQLKIGQCVCWFINLPAPSYKSGHKYIVAEIYAKIGNNSYKYYTAYIHDNSYDRSIKNNIKYKVSKYNTYGFLFNVIQSFKEKKIYRKEIQIFNSIQQSRDYISDNAKRILKLK